MRRAGLDGLIDWNYWFAVGNEPISAEQFTPAMLTAIVKILSDPEESWYVVDGAMMALKFAPANYDDVRLTAGAQNDFNSYISDPAFGLDPAEQGFALDPDGDRIPNGVEAWFGTHPNEFTTGLEVLATDGIAGFVFSVVPAIPCESPT